MYKEGYRVKGVFRPVNRTVTALDVYFFHCTGIVQVLIKAEAEAKLT